MKAAANLGREDRAAGTVRGRPRPEALSVFDQSQFFVDGTLSYGASSLRMADEAPEILGTLRTAIIVAMAASLGSEMTANEAFMFGSGISPQANKRKPRARRPAMVATS